MPKEGDSNEISRRNGMPRKRVEHATLPAVFEHESALRPARKRKCVADGLTPFLGGGHPRIRWAQRKQLGGCGLPQSRSP